MLYTKSSKKEGGVKLRGELQERAEITPQNLVPRICVE
jgi:hypothetical protein